MDSNQQNRHWSAALTRKSIKAILRCWDELVAEDYIDHNPPPFPGLASGREGLKQIFRMFQQATPGTRRIEEQIADGDK